MGKNSIRERLENWAQCQRGGTGARGGWMRVKETRGASPYGGQGYKCMTAVVCKNLAAAATGPAGWKEAQPNAVLAGLDWEDAKLVAAAWVGLPERPKSMLKLAYVLNSPPPVICRKLGIRPWPASHFNAALKSAEDAIEKILGEKPCAPKS